VRATTAFNRLLDLPGTRVRAVSFGDEGIFVEVALRRRRPVCSRCGQVFSGMKDRAPRRWRHLDVAGRRCFIVYRLRRVRCPDCGVRVEALPWARTRARSTRDFEDTVAYLAQQMAKAPITKLMRVSWQTVGAIVSRVVADRLDARRLEGLVEIGCDEVSWRRRQRYLTSVVDHRDGALVWARPGHGAATLQAFFDLLGDRKQSIKAVSIDMSAGYEKAIRRAVPDAEVCFDAFHVVQLANQAVDRVRRAEWNAKGKSKTAGGKWIKHARWSLLKAPERQSERQLQRLGEVAAANTRVYRAFLLKEQLRELYQLDRPEQARDLLRAWLAWASRSKLPPFVKLARTIREHLEGILAAIRLRLSNGRLEGLNSKVRLISHRSFGFRNPAHLIALIYLCCGAITITLPQRQPCHAND
jgi:transposase